MIFRILPDGGIPPDNPFAGLGGAIAKVYAYGLRNVFGLDIDPVSGALWCTDNGPSTYDEIMRLFPGANGGWRRIVGPVARDPDGLADLWSAPGSNYVDPVFSFFQSFGITAIHFQRGAGLGAHYDGDVFVAAHNSATIYHFDVAEDRDRLLMPDSTLDDLVADDVSERDRVRWASQVGVVLDMETGPDGAMYVLRFSTTSQMYRVARAATAGIDPRGSPPARLRFAPNPFVGGTRLLDATNAAPIAIYSPAGRLVRLLPSGTEWDGNDDGGRRCAGGVYLARSGRAAVAIVKLR
jgi:glucose/arabinose dehydrogenase